MIRKCNYHIDCCTAPAYRQDNFKIEGFHYFEDYAIELAKETGRKKLTNKENTYEHK